MNHLIDQYEWTIVEMISGVISLAFLMSIFTNTVILNSNSMKNIAGSLNSVQVEYKVPEIKEFKVENAFLKKDSLFDWKDYVTAVSDDLENLINYVSITGEVNTAKLGKYEILYKLNFHGYSLIKKATYIVREE